MRAESSLEKGKGDGLTQQTEGGPPQGNQKERPSARAPGRDSAASLLDGFLAPIGLGLVLRRGRLLRLLGRVAATVCHVDHGSSPS